MLVNNTKANVCSVNGKILLPGTNTVDKAWWSRARKHPSVKKKIDAGVIVEETEVNEAEMDELAKTVIVNHGDGQNAGLNGNPKAALKPKIEQEDIEHIGAINVRNATTLIKETFNVDLLKAWLKFEKKNGQRSTVIAPIEKQIEAVEAEAELRDRDASTTIDTGKGVEEITLTANPTSQDD